jgi:molecular chaperone HscB
MLSVSFKVTGHILRNRIASAPRSIGRWSSAAARAATAEEADASSSTTDCPKRTSVPKSLDAFALMNVDRRFDLSPEELKQSYHKLMAQLHPDKHHGKPRHVQEALLLQATNVTQSYQLLLKSTTRATHLLQLLGKVGDTFDESSLGELAGQAGNTLLVQVMEIREAIEEAGADQEALKALLKENNQRMQNVYDQLTSAFEAQHLDKAVELTVTLQYYNRIDQTIRRSLEVDG